jgi:type IV secretory pathway TraG/TraD family ATPase VirD4
MKNLSLIGQLIVAIILLAISSLITTIVTLWLWNWIMPILGLPELTFWQMWGLDLLIALLFKTLKFEKNER